MALGARIGTLLLLAAALAAPVSAQRADELRLIGPRGAEGASVQVGFHRGYAAVPLRTLGSIGWTVASTPSGAEARRGDDIVALVERSPFVRWGSAVLQLTAEPYHYGDDLWVPLQLISDILPRRRAEEYAFRSGPVLEVKTAAAWTPDGPARVARQAPAPTPAPSPAEEHRPRVVVIDAGHGGVDTGARGPRGAREKEIALKVALALARELEGDPDIEVRLTRDQDRLVPLWERGEWATGVKGERPGLFISLHANSGPVLSARGFETYFLSEARTEHERRVAALENAPFRESAQGPASGNPELEGIVKELQIFDHQHWSALLAEMVQEEMARVHPGPNRGVKQGPLAVITNSLMPAVLVELGFISNREEERLLVSEEFQADAAHALAQAVDRFFERYPTGATTTGGQR